MTVPRDKTAMFIPGWMAITVAGWIAAFVIDFFAHDKHSNLGTFVGITWSVLQGTAGGFAFGLGGAFVGGIFGIIVPGVISYQISRGKLPSDRRTFWFGDFGYHGFMLGGALGTVVIPVLFALGSTHFWNGVYSQNVLLGSVIGGMAGGLLGDIVDEITDALRLKTEDHVFQKKPESANKPLKRARNRRAPS